MLVGNSWWVSGMDPRAVFDLNKAWVSDGIVF